MSRDVFFLYALTYKREFMGLLYPAKVTTLLLKVKNQKKSSWRDAYKSHNESNIKVIYIPKISKGKFKNNALPTLIDHIFYALACWIFLPYILTHKKIIFVIPPMFTTSIIPILKLFNKKIYIIAKDSEKETMKTYELNWIRNIFYSISRLMEIISIKLANKSFVFSKAIKNDYSQYSTKVAHMPTGADVEAISKNKAKRMFDEFTLTYLGGFEEWRGLDLLIYAVKNLKKSGIKLKVLLIGGGPNQSKLNELAGKDSDIVFTGYLDHEVAISYCKGSDLLVQLNKNIPASRTTSSIKVFEYIACEIPVLVTDSGEHADWIRDLNAGLVVNDTVNSIKKGILKLMNDKKMYNWIKQNQRKNKWKIDYKIFKKEFIHEIGIQK